MKIFWAIVGTLAVGGGLYFIYKRFIESDTPVVDEGTGEQSIPRPNASDPRPIPQVNIALGLRSVLINKSEVSPVYDLVSMDFSSILTNTKGVTPQEAVHFTTQNFQESCPNYVLYKGSLYFLHGDKIVGNGIKTCYYRYSKNILPDSIRVFTGSAPINCVFKMYIGSVEYKFGKTISESGIPTKYYCIYNKQ